MGTHSGFLIKTLGPIPAQGEEVRMEGFHFVIKKVGRRRIHQVLVRKLPLPAGEEKPEEVSS